MAVSDMMTTLFFGMLFITTSSLSNVFRRSSSFIFPSLYLYLWSVMYPFMSTATIFCASQWSYTNRVAADVESDTRRQRAMMGHIRCSLSGLSESFFFETGDSVG